MFLPSHVHCCRDYCHTAGDGRIRCQMWRPEDSATCK